MPHADNRAPGHRLILGAWSVATLLASAPGVALAQDAAATSRPFDYLSGRWSGRGVIEFSDGEKEPLACRVTYFVSKTGAGVAQNLRCSSQGFKIDAKSSFQNKAGKVTGRFTERISERTGTISGRAGPGKLDLTVTGKHAVSKMSIKTKGRVQSIEISSKGGAVARVSINLRKG